MERKEFQERLKEVLGNLKSVWQRRSKRNIRITTVQTGVKHGIMNASILTVSDKPMLKEINRKGDGGS